MGFLRREARPPYWIVVVALCFLGWVFLYSGRTILSPVLGAIGAEWRLDEAQLGLISSVFFLAYTAMQIPTGLLADRFGRKGLLVAGFLLFGVATGLSGLAPSYGVFLVTGALAGLGQGTYYSTQYALSSAVIPPEQRALGSAVINSGMAVGISLGLLVSSFTTFRLGWGWRAPFLVMAGPIILAAVLFARFVHEGKAVHVQGESVQDDGTHPAGTREDRRVGAAVAISQKSAPALPLQFVLTRRLLGLYAVNFTSLYGFFVILTWLPYYLEVVRGFPVETTGFISSLVPWASIPGALLVSAISDRTGRRLHLVRALLVLAALSIMGIVYAKSRLVLFACLILYGLVGKLAMDPLVVALTSEWAPAGRMATAMAFLNFAGMASSVLAPYVTGYLTSATGRMDLAFFIAGTLLLAGFGIALAMPDRAQASVAPPRQSAIASGLRR